MAEIIASLPDAHLVCSYLKDYADTDTESEGEAQDEVDTDDEEESSISTRLQQNQQYMDHQITPASGEHSVWLLEPQTWKTTKGTDVVLVRKPTASNLSHRLFNPFIYRNIKNIGTLDALATLLDTPDDWETKYNQVVEDGFIIRKLNRFSRLPEDTLEADIQSQFIGLVEAIASRLGVDLISSSETKIIVGESWQDISTTFAANATLISSTLMVFILSHQKLKQVGLLDWEKCGITHQEVFKSYLHYMHSIVLLFSLHKDNGNYS
jgi:hypothetical protein